ncbi:MAG: hypothetical protein ACTS3R_01845 [Inquilinaceae bacterium]
MPPRKNPLKLNALQLKTLVLLQQLAKGKDPGPTGEVTVGGFPPPHGNHYHIGDAVVAGRDATGLHNPAVFVALERKGLARALVPGGAVLTPEGLAYETGMESAVLHRADH